MKKYAERLLQVLIILACVTLLGYRWFPTSSSAQISCNGHPPIRSNSNPNPYFRLSANTWINGTQVAVTIFDSPPAEFSAINEGILSWNPNTNCSFVNFASATEAKEGTDDPIVPADELWVVRSYNTQVFPRTDVLNQMISSYIRVQTPFTSSTPNALRNLLRHETGHTFGLVNDDLGYPTIMSGPYTEITSCDVAAIRSIYCPTPTPTPTPTPAPTPTPGTCNQPPDYVTYPETGCASGFQVHQGICDRSETFKQRCFRFGGYDFDSCNCIGACGEDGSCSPIVVDVLGNGFDLTAARNGVNFDINNDGSDELLAWTKSSSDDAWLALDRNYNDVIDSGKELFGNVTPQPPPAEGQEMNGFLALGVYDTFAYGGNRDGFITRHDAIFDRLKLWQDQNHNGVSESCELFSLPDLGLRKIELDYRQSDRVDAHGNQFKYRARVRDAQDAQLGRWAGMCFWLFRSLKISDAQ
jgi:hypothetical protein